MRKSDILCWMTILVHLSGNLYAQSRLPSSPLNIFGRSTAASNFNMRVYNDGVVAVNDRSRDEFDSIWPHERTERYVEFSTYSFSQCGMWFGCISAGRKIVSAVSTPYRLPSAIDYLKFKFVPGAISDPNAGLDTAFNAAGWKYFDDPNYIVYSSMDYDENGIDWSGNNFPDWPIRNINGVPAYIRDVLARVVYPPMYRSDEDLFCVYKDTETEVDPEYWGRSVDPETTSIPIGLEIRQTIFSWRDPPLRDVLIIHYEIHNESRNILENSYVGFEIWPLVKRASALRDSNVIQYYDADPSRNLGYQYNTALRDSIAPYLGVGLIETPRNSNGQENGMTFWTEDIYHNMSIRPRSDFTDIYRYDYMTRDSIEITREVVSGLGQAIKNSIFAGGGAFVMPPGDSVGFTVALMVGSGLNGLLRLHDLVRRVYANDYLVPQPPPDPTLSYTALDGAIRLRWNAVAEHSPDPIVPDSLARSFLGYRLYRARSMEGPYYMIHEWQLGRDSLLHEYIDNGADGVDPTIPAGTTLLNNVSYFYKLTAYDEAARSLSLQSMESQGKSIRASPGASPRVEGDVSEIRIVPNPYVVSHQAQTSIDEPVIYFNYLPEECTIRIYTVGLDLVKEIEHHGGPTATWDLRTEAGQQVASQLYIAHITTPEGRTAIRKFAVITGQ